MQQEVFIPIKIDTKKGRKANIIKPDDAFVNTNLARLLAKAYLLETQLINEPRATLNEFCKMNGISPRYLRTVISLNLLSPKIKRAIMDGYVPKHLSVQKITNHKMRLVWEEQEQWIFCKQ